MTVHEPATTPPTAWAPLRHPVFRALFLAQLASNVGTWMQTVGAQWLMADLTGSVLLVALIQTASTLPVLVMALPAGALGDIVDRRRLLLASQAMMLAAAAGLAVVTAAGLASPAVLLGLTAVIGIGQALTAPSWQAIQPELVPARLIPQASALGGVNMNLARAAGPALGGLLVAAAGAEAVFALNAASFLAVIAVLRVWRRPHAQSPLGAEPVGQALRTGLRWVRSSPRLRIVLVRTAVFIVFSSALWALIPVVARDRLGLGSGGYGALLAALGVGAAAGGVLLTRLRARLDVDAVVRLASVAFAVSVVALAAGPLPLVIPGLLLGGAAWIAVLATANAAAQTILPGWVRARGMAVHLLVVQGGQAVGSVIWGVVAETAGTTRALEAAAVGLLAGVVVARRFRLRSTDDIDTTPSRHWPDPVLALQAPPGPGARMMVTVDYRVPAANAAEFVEAMQPVGRSRRRGGARRWSLWQDAADPGRFVEAYVVGSWEEHMRQHRERLTVVDQVVEQRARDLLEPGSVPTVAHLVIAEPEPSRGSGGQVPGGTRRTRPAHSPGR